MGGKWRKSVGRTGEHKRHHESAVMGRKRRHNGEYKRLKAAEMPPKYSRGHFHAGECQSMYLSAPIHARYMLDTDR